MNATFTCKTSELRKALKGMQPALPKNRAFARSYLCEITVLDGKIRLVLLGIEYFVACRVTKSTCKFILPFVYFHQIVKDYEGRIFNAFIEPGILRWGNSNSKDVDTTFFEDDSILRSIDMPINPLPQDFIQQGETHTVEELKFNDMYGSVLYFERKMERDIGRATHYLSVYGVTEKEVRALIEGKRKVVKEG